MSGRAQADARRFGRYPFAALLVTFLAAALPANASAACGPENAFGQRPPAPNLQLHQQAERAYRSGAYEQALALWRQVADAGESEVKNLPANYPWREAVITQHYQALSYARFAIGNFYDTGKAGLAQDYGQAARWYEAALKTRYCNQPPANNALYLELGRLYYYGAGVKRDRNRAVQLWNSATPPHSNLVRLAEADAMPATIDGLKGFDVRQAVARLGPPPPASLSRAMQTGKGTAAIAQSGEGSTWPEICRSGDFERYRRLCESAIDRNLQTNRALVFALTLAPERKPRMIAYCAYLVKSRQARSAFDAIGPAYTASQFSSGLMTARDMEVCR